MHQRVLRASARNPVVHAWLRAPRWLRILTGSVLLVSVSLGGFFWWFFNPPKGSATECIAKNVYWEAAAARQPLLGLEAVAWVTIARARDNRPYWGGSLPCDVVYQQHSHGGKPRRRTTAQFSWTLEAAAKREPASLWEWVRSVIATRTVLWIGYAPADLGPARYYLNLHTAGKRGRCWFYRRGLVEMRTIGDHTFFRESAPGELRGPLPPDCRHSP